MSEKLFPSIFYFFCPWKVFRVESFFVSREQNKLSCLTSREKKNKNKTEAGEG